MGGSRGYGYRTKLTPHFLPVSARREKESFPIGFYSQKDRRILDVEECALATKAINDRLDSLREETRERYNSGGGGRERPDHGATLLLRQDDSGVSTDPNEELSERVGNLRFGVLAGEFWQTNAEALPLLVAHVVEEASNQGNLRSLVDCFCGGGLFAISAAHRFDKVRGLDISLKNVESARANARLNGLGDMVEFSAGKCEDLFSTVSAFSASETAFIIDPPRKGCSAEFLELLVAFGPARVVYVSCDPATQARDARHLLVRNYALRRVLPFDLFPQTRHIESVATFDRISAPSE